MAKNEAPFMRIDDDGAYTDVYYTDAAARKDIETLKAETYKRAGAPYRSVSGQGVTFISDEVTNAPTEFTIKATADHVGVYDAELTLDGSEPWAIAIGSVTTYFTARLSGVKAPVNTSTTGVADIQASSYLSIGNATQAFDRVYVYWHVDSSTTIARISITDINSIEELRAYLTAHPLHIWYQSAEFGTATLFYDTIKISDDNGDKTYAIGPAEPLKANDTADFVNGIVTHYDELSFPTSEEVTKVSEPILFKGAVTISSNDRISVTYAGSYQSDIEAVSESVTSLGENVQKEINHLSAIVLKEPWTGEFKLTNGNFINRPAIGSDWHDAIGTTVDVCYTEEAIDISYALGGTIKIELPDATQASVAYGFCNADDITSYTNLVRNDMVLNESTGKYEINKPITDTHMFFSFRPADSIITVTLTPASDEVVSPDVLFVSPNGNDEYSGTISTPKQTVNAALAAGARTVLLRDGVYEQTIDLSLAHWDSVELRNYDKLGRAIFRAPNSLLAENETLVEGYEHVYSAPCERTFVANNILIFQDSVADASTLINESERMPQQRGFVYRCSDTAISHTAANTLAEALAEIENATTAYLWFHDAENNTLYFSRPQPITKQNPLRGSFNTNLFSGASRAITIKASGIENKYQIFNVADTLNSTLIDCRSTNVFGAGCFLYDGVSGLTMVRCEAARAYFGKHGDGISGHGNLTDEPYTHITDLHLIDCWCHDNVDDGFSDHEHCESVVDGGLFEHNYRGGGIVPSTGSHCVCRDAYCRENGEAGFLMLNTPNESEGGVGSQFICYNCVSDHNDNWPATSKPKSGVGGFKIDHMDNRGVFINCVAMNEVNGFIASNGATATAINCSTVNCTNAKLGEDIEVITPTPLT